MALDNETMLALLGLQYRAYMERARADPAPSLDQLSVSDARKLMRGMQQADVSAYPVTDGAAHAG